MSFAAKVIHSQKHEDIFSSGFGEKYLNVRYVCHV